MDRSFARLMMSLIGVLGLVTINISPLQAASPIWTPEGLSQLVEEGLSNNKEIQSLEAKVESMREEISFAGSLPDPRLGFSILNLPTDTFSFNQEPMTQKQIFLAQKIPWLEKLIYSKQRQALSAGCQQAILETKRLALARQIATNYYELGFVAWGLEINGRLREILDQLIRVAETRYATGKGLQQDVLQAQVELSKLLDEKIVLERKRRTVQNRINALLNREAFRTIEPPKNLEEPKLELNVKLLQAQSVQNNPWLKLRQAEIDLASMGIKLARMEYRPDMDLKVAYGQREDDLLGMKRADFFSASVAINIPLWFWSRQVSKVSASRKSHQATMRSYQGLKATLPHQVDTLVTEIKSSQENYRLFSDALILQSEQWARSSLSAYVVGKVEFNTMINAQIRLLRFQLKTKRYLFYIYQKRAELVELLGGALHTKNHSKDS